jgi:hypothetical protein
MNNHVQLYVLVLYFTILEVYALNYGTKATSNWTKTVSQKRTKLVETVIYISIHPIEYFHFICSYFMGSNETNNTFAKEGFMSYFSKLNLNKIQLYP